MSQVSFTSKIQGLTKSEWSQVVSGGSSGSTGSSSSAISGQMANHLTELASWFAKDENGNIYLTKDENNNARSFWSYGEITAGGSGSGGGEGGGALYALADVKKATNADAVARYQDIASAAQEGDLLMRGGDKWYALSKGSNNQILTIVNGVPSWTNAPATGVTSISVNGGSAQTGAVSLTIPTSLSQLAADATHRLVADTQIGTWNGKQDAITASNKLAYSLISGTPDLSDMATKTWVGSQGYLTSISEATSSAYGGIKIGYSASGKNYAVQLSSGKAYVNVPWTDTTYSAGTGITITNNAVAIDSTYQTYIANGNTAYGWGNHASVGYLTTSAAASTYLPLTGGALYNANTDTPLVIKSPTTYSNGAARIEFCDSNNIHTGYVVAGWGAIYIGAKEGYILQLEGSTNINGLTYGSPSGNPTYTIYHSGNCNNTSTDWACASLTIGYGSYGSRQGFYCQNRAKYWSIGVFTTDNTFRWDVTNDAGTAWLATRMSLDASGNLTCAGKIGIGTTSPSEKLHIVGNVLATGEITAGSDLRWKDNITDIDSSLLYKLKPCEWDWKEGHGTGHSAGLIAQSVAEVIPYAVKGDEESGLTLNYNVFHAFEIAEIQNLRRQVAELKLRVNQLENIN